MEDWLLLTATLPTQPSGLRVRVWRALKGTGAASLRDGVYLLPAFAPTAAALKDIEQAVRDGGADAHLLLVVASDTAQEQVFRGLFDRSKAYDGFLQALKVARAGLDRATPAALQKTLRDLDRQLAGVQASDFFPTRAGERAGVAMATLRREIETRLSPGEPTRAARALRRQSIGDYRGRQWATRRRPRVDRLASAWLVRRFIDPGARFIWMATAVKCPRRAVGFDFDGATFTHVGDKVTFEVLAGTFGLDADPALKRVGDLVHCVDVGGIPVDAAAGVDTLVRGLQAQHADDDALLEAALPLFDALYAGLGVDE